MGDVVSAVAAGRVVGVADARGARAVTSRPMPGSPAAGRPASALGTMSLRCTKAPSRRGTKSVRTLLIRCGPRSCPWPPLSHDRHSAVMNPPLRHHHWPRTCPIALFCTGVDRSTVRAMPIRMRGSPDLEIARDGGRRRPGGRPRSPRRPRTHPRAPRESRPVYSYENAVRESVWVDTGLDGDGDGKTDRVAVDIVRPREPAATGPQDPGDHGRQPVLLLLRARQREPEEDVRRARATSSSSRCSTTTTSCRAATPSSRVDLAGTNRSDGCVDVGGRSDIQSAKAVVDWLNGRATAYTTPHRHRPPPRPSWTNGRDRHDRQELGRHHRQRRRRHRRRGPQDHRPDRRHLLLVRLLLRQGRPALRLGPRLALRLRREPRRPRQLRRRPAAARRRGPAHRRLDPAVERARLRAGRASKVKASVFVVHGMQDLNVRIQALRPVVGRARRRTASSARSGSPRPATSTRSTSAAPRGSTPCTAGSTTTSSATTTASNASPWPTSNAHPDQWVTPTASGRRAPPTPPPCAPRTGGRAGRRHARPAQAPQRRTRDVHRRPAAERDRLGGADRHVDARQGRASSPGRSPATCGVSGSSTVTVTVTPTTVDAPTCPPSSSTSAPTPSATTRRAARASARSPTAPAGARAPRATAPASGRHRRRRPTSDYTVFSRGWADLGNHASGHGPSRSPRARRTPSPSTSARHRPRRPGRPPPRADRRGHRQGPHRPAVRPPRR